MHCYPFAVRLDRCVGSCNALNDLSDKVWVPKKTKDLNLSMFNMITGINELKVLTEHITCKRKSKFDGRKCNLDQWWNNNKCRCECRKHICEKDYIWNPSACSCEKQRYIVSIMDDSMITCNEIIVIQERNKSSSNKFYWKKQPV